MITMEQVQEIGYKGAEQAIAAFLKKEVGEGPLALFVSRNTEDSWNGPWETSFEILSEDKFEDPIDYAVRHLSSPDNKFDERIYHALSGLQPGDTLFVPWDEEGSLIVNPSEEQRKRRGYSWRKGGEEDDFLVRLEEFYDPTAELYREVELVVGSAGEIAKILSVDL